MNNKTDIYEKWDKMSQKSKRNYMFMQVPLQKTLPLMLALISVDIVIMRDYDVVCFGQGVK